MCCFPNFPEIFRPGINNIQVFLSEKEDWKLPVAILLLVLAVVRHRRRSVKNLIQTVKHQEIIKEKLICIDNSAMSNYQKY